MLINRCSLATARAATNFTRSAVRLLPRQLKDDLQRLINNHHVSVRYSRYISTHADLKLLGLSKHDEHNLNIKELRQAYFAAAKLCHPDMQQENGADSKPGHDEFLRVTAAYERLSQSLSNGPSSSSNIIIDADEEADFRAACDLQLGVPAEIVEECKRSPIFRRWLAGRTDAAHTWRNFLTQNGGLAPKLPIIAGELGMNKQNITSSRLQSRRKRR